MKDNIISRYVNKNNNNNKISLTEIRQRIYLKYIINRYANIDSNFWNIQMINDIISNNSTRLVSLFKDYLIQNDYNEFIQNYVPLKNSLYQIIELCEYYHSSCMIFPNYCLLPESVYLSKNILKKQNLIDFIHDEQEHRRKKNRDIKLEENKLYKNIKFNEEEEYLKEEIFDSNVNHFIWDLTENNSEVLRIMGIINNEVQNIKELKNNNDSVENLIKVIEHCEAQHTSNKFKFKFDFNIHQLKHISNASLSTAINKNTNVNQIIKHIRLKSNLGIYIKTNELLSKAIKNKVTNSLKNNTNTNTLNNNSNLKTTRTSNSGRHNLTSSNNCSKKHCKIKTQIKIQKEQLKFALGLTKRNNSPGKVNLNSKWSLQLDIKNLPIKQRQYINSFNLTGNKISLSSRNRQINSLALKTIDNNNNKTLSPKGNDRSKNKDTKKTQREKSYEVKSRNDKNKIRNQKLTTKKFLNTVIIKELLKQKKKDVKCCNDNRSCSERVKRKYNPLLKK